MNILKYLNQPFPKQEKKWKLIVSISLFVALFLIVFQPFRINLTENKNIYLILIGYGLITFCTLVVNLIFIEDIFKDFFNDLKWTIWKEFIWLIWIIFSIGLGNAFYTSFVFGMYFKINLTFFIHFQFITLSVGILPITVLILIKQKYLYKKHSNSANELNQNLTPSEDSLHLENRIKIIADNEKDFVEFNLNDFLFIESSGNYVEVNLTEKKETLRCTIKRCMSFFKTNSGITQCHRAFIVNSTKIINAKGNSQGLKLKLKDCEAEIPVSRNYVKSIKEMIQ